MKMRKSVLQYQRRGANMENIKIKTLPCGVRVVTEKISHVNSAAIGIWVRNGAVDESREVAGISHFIEHLMFLG